MIITKIHIHNTESFSDTNHFHLSKRQKVGVMLTSFILAGSVLAFSLHGSVYQEEIDAMIPPFSASVVLEDVNQMNLILNDNNCSDAFFQEVVHKLKEDGIQVTTAKDGADINQNNATVITLDQQYSAGPGTIIFAPYDNARVGQSDSLALAMQAAFHQNGFLVDAISCGKVGYEVDEEGNVHTFLPTDTEKAIPDGYDSSFVTISFGTQNLNAEWVAKSIENGLARQNYYLNSDNNQTDLIYRASSTDSIESVAGYFSTDASHLRKTNHMGDSTFTDSQTVINPEIENIPAFDKTGMFQIGEEKTRAY